MTVEPSVAVVILSAMVGLQAWTLVSVVELKTKVAAMAEHCRLTCKYEKEEKA
jgi:hypothetical protein